MFRLLRRQSLPIGIDFGFDTVRVAQLRPDRPGKMSIVAAARKTFATPDVSDAGARAAAAVEAVRSIMAMGEFAGHKAVVSLPGQMLHIRTVRLPAPRGATLNEVPAELIASFDFDLTGAPLQILHAGSVHGQPAGDEMIALAVKREESERLTDLLRKAGIRTVFEARLLALHRAALRVASAEPVTAILDLGGDEARVLIARDGRVRFLRSVPASNLELSRTLARALGITLDEAQQLRRRLALTGGAANEQNDPVRRAVADASRAQMEALAVEVSRCLRYHAVTFRGPQPSTLLLSGEEALDAQLHGFLQVNTRLSLRPIAPFAGINTDRMRSADRASAPHEWGVAVGLALKFAAERGVVEPAVAREPLAASADPAAA